VESRLVSLANVLNLLLKVGEQAVDRVHVAEEVAVIAAAVRRAAVGATAVVRRLLAVCRLLIITAVVRLLRRRVRVSRCRVVTKGGVSTGTLSITEFDSNDQRAIARWPLNLEHRDVPVLLLLLLALQSVSKPFSQKT
jgi:hypothetical protein